jgi:hypothetical protein
VTDDSAWRRPDPTSVPDPDLIGDAGEPTIEFEGLPVGHFAGFETSAEPDVFGATDPTPVDGVPRVTRRARRRRRWIVRTLLGVATALLLLVGYYGITLYQVWSTGHHRQNRAVDAIVVLGAAQYDGRPSPLLKARLDHAVELYEQQFAPVIVVTGGKQVGDRFTEASTSRKYLSQHGVPPSAILAEDQGHSTWQSLDGVAVLLAQRTKRPTVLLVTDPFHCLRAKLIAEELHLRAYVSATATSPWGSGTQFRKSLKEAAGIALGRVIGFHRLWKVTG